MSVIIYERTVVSTKPISSNETGGWDETWIPNWHELRINPWGVGKTNQERSVERESRPERGIIKRGRKILGPWLPKGDFASDTCSLSRGKLLVIRLMDIWFTWLKRHFTPYQTAKSICAISWMTLLCLVKTCRSSKTSDEKSFMAWPLNQ